MIENVCPYKVSGICYRRGCIFHPQQPCMKDDEFRQIMGYLKKHNKSKKKGGKRK